MGLGPKRYIFFSILLSLVFVCLTIVCITVYSIFNVPTYSIPPKIIWTYWNDQDIPPLVQTILHHRANILTGWNQIILSDETLKEYVNPPKEYYELGQTHKSDWLRLALLQKYGGCWMDASIIVNSESALNEIYNKSIQQKSEFTGFYTPIGLLHNDTSTFIESWCLLAPKGSQVIGTWLDEYEQACRIGFPEYRRKVTKENEISTHIYNPETEDVYLTVYAACQMAIQKRLRKQANIILYNSYDSMYKLHHQCWDAEKNDYDHDCIVLRLHTDPSVKQIPFIKITGHTRKFLEKVDISSYFIDSRIQ